MRDDSAKGPTVKRFLLLALVILGVNFFLFTVGMLVAFGDVHLAGLGPILVRIAFAVTWPAQAAAVLLGRSEAALLAGWVGGSLAEAGILSYLLRRIRSRARGTRRRRQGES